MIQVAMIVSNRYDPDPRVHKEAVALASAGHRVTIYAFDRMHESPPRETLQEGVELVRVRARESPMGDLVATGLGLRSFRAKVRRLIAKDPPDVVHCHDQDTCEVGIWWKYLGSKAAGLPSAKFVFDAHDLYWTWLRMPDPDSTWRRAGAKVLKAQGLLYARSADLVITVTEGNEQHPGVAEIFKGWGANTEVIWNAPEQPESVPALPGRFTIGYIGTVREPVMFQWLIDAIEQIPPDERPAVLVAGAGIAQVEVTEMMTEASARLGFSVDLTGGFEMKDIPSLFAKTSAQYCVYPSARGQISRSVPVKMLESLAYGRPVIGNSDTLFGDLIETNDWGRSTTAGDPTAIASAISAVKKSLEDVTHYMDFIAPPLSWDTEAKKLIRLYKDLES